MEPVRLVLRYWWADLSGVPAGVVILIHPSHVARDPPAVVRMVTLEDPDEVEAHLLLDTRLTTLPSFGLLQRRKEKSQTEPKKNKRGGNK